MYWQQEQDLLLGGTTLTCNRVRRSPARFFFMHGRHLASMRLVTFCTLNHADGVACLKLCTTYENPVSSDSVEEAKHIGRPEYVMLCSVHRF